MTNRAAIPSSFYKVAVFTVITTLLFALVATLIGNITFESRRSFRAVFTDATGVYKGDKVRLSGVEVGTVTGIELVTSGERKVAKLTFTVASTVPVYKDAELQLRYQNIVGQRFLNISEKAGSGPKQSVGGTFPVSQTTPALNLTELFNGFQPLFRALDPEQLNRLSFDLVRSLQGEGDSFKSLLENTAQLTNTIADRDQVIGSVVTNLNTVLETVGTRDAKLTDLIKQFRNLMSGLSKDRDVIDASLPSLKSLLDNTTGLITDVRVPLKSNIGSLKTLASQVYEDRATLDRSLKNLPFTERTLARTGSYGSWFNFYVCGLDVRLSLLGGTVKLGGVGLGANDKNTVCAGGTE